MTFGFRKLSIGSVFSNTTDPVELFCALANEASESRYLRGVQTTVLQAWAPRRDKRDLVIKGLADRQLTWN